MNFSDAPSNKIPEPFAQNGIKNTIPQTIGSQANSATWDAGFPAITMQPYPPAGNGQPPLGGDFNGVLNQISAQVRYLTAGVIPPYDLAWATAAGGYPKNAIISKAAGSGWWYNLVDGNTTNPDTGGANWVDYQAFFFANAALTGNATAPTKSIGDNTTAISTTAFLQNNALGAKGYSYNNVLGSRALNTTFTNSTGRAIFVVANMTSSSPNQRPELVTGGVVIPGTGQGSAGLGMSTFGIVKPGDTYLVRISNGAGGTLLDWVELS